MTTRRRRPVYLPVTLIAPHYQVPSVRCLTTPGSRMFPSTTAASEGGSILKLPTFSTWPSSSKAGLFRSCDILHFFMVFFSASGLGSTDRFLPIRGSEMRVKSQQL